MEDQKQHFRHILLSYYRKGKNAVQARRKLCARRRCIDRTPMTKLDTTRPEWPLEADVEKIKSLVDAIR